MSRKRFHNCKEELQEVALKATPIRLAVLHLLENSKHPLDVASIIAYLYKKNIPADQATVFRLINAFTQKGLTRQIQLNEGKARYELATNGDHHHLVCQHCGNIEDISDCNITALEQDIRKRKKFIVKSHSLEFFGVCFNCQT